MINATLQSDLDRLATLLLPELPAPYWLDAADLPAESRLPALGYAGRTLDVASRDAIGSAWRGRGPCIVLDIEGIRAASEAGDQTANVLAVAIHELAHVADDGFDPRQPTERLAAYATAVCDLSIACYATDFDIKDDKPPWYLHGPHWLRIVAHACDRAERAGFAFSPYAVWQRDNRTCPLLHTALATCHAELETLADVPLTRINTRKPGDDYRGLWSCKTTRWRETRPADNPDADRRVREALAYFD